MVPRKASTYSAALFRRRRRRLPLLHPPVTAVKRIPRTLLSTTLLFAPGGAVALGQDTPPIPEDTEVVTTGSGLKYSVLAEGDGSEFPGYGDRVRVHYTGWLPDGTLFDSSRQRGEPSEFAVGGVIEGWNEALLLMSPGARFKLTIPPELGYGDRPRPKIPAGSTLIFDVELLAIPARTMPYVPWTDEGGQTTASGLRYRVLADGKGVSCKDADLVVIDFAMYDAQGKPMVSSTMQGGPLVGDPENLQLQFLSELVPSLSSGAHVLAQVPGSKSPALSGRLPGFDEGATYLWQVRVEDARSFEKPEFVLPLEEELQSTESGLRYQVLREGTGERPTARSSVVAHYAGWLTDGTPFDNSYDRGAPSTFPLNRVIPGWTEGLQLMRAGGKYLFVIPSELGYGPGGSPPKIPGGATLVFVVELVDVR